MINETTVITAHHILNKNMGPNPGFKYYRLWLLKRGVEKLVLTIKFKSLEYFPEIDTTIIKLNQKLTETPKIKLENYSCVIGEQVYNIGHIAGKMPIINAKWDNDNLVINDYSLSDDVKSDKIGSVIAKMNFYIQSDDINLNNVAVIQPSFEAIIGGSGGPLLNKKNKLVGLMSFGFPPDVPHKEILFAVSVNELIRGLGKN